MPQTRYAQLFDVADKVLRSWWTLVAGVCLGLAASTVALHYTPKMYEANTTIYVDAKGISKEYVQAPVADDLAIRLGALQEAVLSRPYLTKLIAEEYGELNAEEQERLIRSIRTRVRINFSRSAQLFEIHFVDQDPERAARVTNMLAGLYIEENAKLRSERASESTETIRGLMEDALEEVQAQEKEISTYRHQHLHETPEREVANLQLLASRQAELASNLDTQEDLEVALRDARDAKKSIDGLMVPDSPGGPSPLGLRIREAEDELKSLQARYLPSHPMVQSKQRELEDLRAELVARGPDVDAGGAEDQGASPPSEIDLKIRDIERELAEYKEDEQEIRAKIAEYQRRIDVTPTVEQQLADLSKGYDVLSQKYESYNRMYVESRDSQKLEEERKHSRFQVLDAAVPPSIPLSPKPAQLYGIGLIAGLLLFVGPVLLRQVLKPTVGSESRLRELSEVPILVSIPTIETPETLRRARFVKIRNFGFSLLSVAVLAAVMVTLR